MPSSFSVRKLSELKSVLYNRNIAHPKQEVYYVIRSVNSDFGIEPNITIIPPARLSQEYPKTFGHYHKKGEGETYRVLYGWATLLIQKMKNDKPDEIEDFQILTGEAGDIIEVPPNYAHCLANTTDDLLITADWESEDAGHIYEPIKKLGGMGYFLIEEKDKPVLVKNKNYKILPKVALG